MVNSGRCGKSDQNVFHTRTSILDEDYDNGAASPGMLHLTSRASHGGTARNLIIHPKVDRRDLEAEVGLGVQQRILVQ